ncbi:hypothetical protein HUJ04_011157 [Dendroctonus ponderosae]|nr:hypothetical protein HUJ04_011157 [Dendroctonus ponderosae]
MRNPLHTLPVAKVLSRHHNLRLLFMRAAKSERFSSRSTQENRSAHTTNQRRDCSNLCNVPRIDCKNSGDGGSPAIWECPLCLAELTPDDFCELNACGHRACITCFQHYLRVEITESRVCISCPECLEPMHPNEGLMMTVESARPNVPLKA